MCGCAVARMGTEEHSGLHAGIWCTLAAPWQHVRPMHAARSSRLLPGVASLRSASHKAAHCKRCRAMRGMEWACELATLSSRVVLPGSALALSQMHTTGYNGHRCVMCDPSDRLCLQCHSWPGHQSVCEAGPRTQ